VTEPDPTIASGATASGPGAAINTAVTPMARTIARAGLIVTVAIIASRILAISGTSSSAGPSTTSRSSTPSSRPSASRISCSSSSPPVPSARRWSP
jgi:hypothetical protein